MKKNFKEKNMITKYLRTFSCHLHSMRLNATLSLIITIHLSIKGLECLVHYHPSKLKPKKIGTTKVFHLFLLLVSIIAQFNWN